MRLFVRRTGQSSRRPVSGERPVDGDDSSKGITDPTSARRGTDEVGQCSIAGEPGSRIVG